MLVLISTQFSLVKAMILTTSTRRMNLSVFLVLMLMSTHFPLAYTCACAYAYAHSSENQALETLLKNLRLNLQLPFLEVSGVVYSAYYGRA